ncbi:MAG: prolyl oligopeptidase family serine peptidase [Rhodospirillales bacterium]
MRDIAQPLTGPERLPADGSAPDSVVVMLHGLGADGSDLIGLAPDFARLMPRTAFLSPDAPYACDMAPFGRQWFSLLDRAPEVMARNVAASAPILDAYLDTVLSRFALAPSRLALLGFSQGTMMALHVAFRREMPIAGIVGFSGRLTGAETFASEAVSRPPALLIHGTDDDVVPFESLALAEAALDSAGVRVTAMACPGLGHGIDEQGMSAAADFLLRNL